ncbi:MAG: protein phosphatase 2C domain-containing protein [Pseudomonadota bacterium]
MTGTSKSNAPGANLENGEVKTVLLERLKRWFEQSEENSQFSSRAEDVDFFCLNSNVGLKRSENQDRTAALFVNSGGATERSFYCFVLCDGMGGMPDGETAASISISTFLEVLILNRKLRPEQRLEDAARSANLAVRSSVGGGSTLSAVLFVEDAVYLINVGDSRIYTYSKEEGVRRQTTDDNLKEFAGGSDERLLQFIGMGDGMRPHIRRVDTHFDLIFLTSDGVHSLSADLFEQIVQHSPSPTELCYRLVSTALWTGGRDNASVIGVSNAVQQGRGRDRNGPEIAVWNNKSEMQILWAEEDWHDQSIHQPQLRSENLDEKIDDELELIEPDELNLEGGRDNRKRSSKDRKKKSSDEPKDTFGDFG